MKEKVEETLVHNKTTEFNVKSKCSNVSSRKVEKKDKTSKKTVKDKDKKESFPTYLKFTEIIKPQTENLEDDKIS
jgi:hypothetical protein